MNIKDNTNSSSKDGGCGCDCGCSDTKEVKVAPAVNQTLLSPAVNQKQQADCFDYNTGNDDDYIESMIKGYRDTPAGRVAVTGTHLEFSDKTGALKARLNINRNNYMIKPDVYSIGNPDTASPVMVTSNYKLSFDHLRKELKGIDAWILVLDTRGINVWCAAGKGTFGTEELINRIKVTGLDKIVGHRKLIVPQLGAPGVSAHEVVKATGFKVVYGPVRASDIKGYLDAGMKADKKMRQVKFTLYDRFILIPVELSIAIKYLVLIAGIFFILSGINSSGFSLSLLLDSGLKSAVIVALAFISGTIISPLLLPLIPGRAFSLKGMFAGIILYGLLIILFPNFIPGGIIDKISWFLLSGSVSSFLAMNFTGASTYTSLSGVMKEMKIAVPVQAAASIIGIILWITGRFI